MQKIYYYGGLPDRINKSIFLAGPTPRRGNTQSWRPQALETLKELGYDGTVILPELEKANESFEYDYQKTFDWERMWLNACDAIVFWVPRSDLLPGFTTNIEYGNFINTGKAVAGSPPDAPKMQYLRAMAVERGMPWFDSMKDTLSHALRVIGDGIRRQGAECMVPRNIHSKPEFQEWYKEQVASGNELRSLAVEYVSPSETVWFARATVFSAKEGMEKKMFLGSTC